MQRSVAVTILALLVTGALLAGPTGAATPDRSAFVQPEGFDETTFDITVYENQSARWTFEHRRTLENDSEVQQFRDFARKFETNETELYRSFVNRSRSLVAVGTESTGRDMSAIAHARSASVQQLGQRQGVVKLSFTWTNFGVKTDERVVIGDVFQGGLPIGANQRLVVHPGPNLTFASAQPEDYELSGENLSGSDSVTWFGERRFSDERPRVEFVTPGAAGDPGDAGSNTVMFVGLLLIVAVLGAGLAYQRGVFDTLPGQGPDDDDGATSASSGDDAPPSPPPEPEVISDRDRVKDLLADNGGRMKQVRIVDETDWSKSKVSMLLSEMEEEGDISKLRVGRENIVSLAGHEPDAAGSPFEDE